MQLDQPTRYQDARFLRLPDDCSSSIDRLPFGYEHNLCNLDLFEFEALRDLARKFDHDYFVASGAHTPAADFYSVKYGEFTPYEALNRLEIDQQRVLLKRPEQYDPRYRELMHHLFDQAIALRGGLARGERLLRLDSSILISSAATITPFHFDPEVSFFFQIAGDKDLPSVRAERSLGGRTRTFLLDGHCQYRAGRSRRARPAAGVRFLSAARPRDAPATERPTLGRDNGIPLHFVCLLV